MVVIGEWEYREVSQGSKQLLQVIAEEYANGWEFVQQTSGYRSPCVLFRRKARARGTG